MKKFLLTICAFASIATYAQSNVDNDIVGTWSVVNINRLTIPPQAKMDPTKDYDEIVKSMRFDFGSDHHFRVETSDPQFNLDDGYWLAKGNRIAIGKWEDQGANLSSMTLDVQQRDGSWFFVVAGIADVEVRKD